jgi:putative ABC transport system permease protein
MATRRSVPLAWRNVTSNKRKFALSVAGVTFAVLLMFAELGFLTGVIDGQVRLIGKLSGDLVLVSSSKANMFVAQPFPKDRLQQVAGLPDVRLVSPVYLATGISWKATDNGLERFLRVVGFDPDRPTFLDPEISSLSERLKERDTVLVDRAAATYFGPLRAGEETELGSRHVRIIGTFAAGVDLPSRGTAIVSERTFRMLQGQGTNQALGDQVEIGLVHLRPGADVEKARSAIEGSLAHDVRVLTREGYLQSERNYFLFNTPIGLMFALGVLMGAVVAGFICYQILYADVLDNMGQYATLKAMGYTTRAISGVVLKQAGYLGLLGFAVGLFFTRGLYSFLGAQTGFPMAMTPGRVVSVLALTQIACAVAAVLAARKPLAADPAEAF